MKTQNISLPPAALISFTLWKLLCALKSVQVVRHTNSRRADCRTAVKSNPLKHISPRTRWGGGVTVTLSLSISTDLLLPHKATAAPPQSFASLPFSPGAPVGTLSITIHSPPQQYFIRLPPHSPHAAFSRTLTAAAGRTRTRL